MEKLRWSEDKPDKTGLWAYCANKSPDRLSIEGICYGPNTAQKGDYLFCYLGPIPVIAPPPTYRQPKDDKDIGKAVELSKVEYKHNPNSQKIVWEKDYTIHGYQIKHNQKQFWINHKYFGCGFWVVPDRLRILE